MSSLALTSTLPFGRFPIENLRPFGKRLVSLKPVVSSFVQNKSRAAFRMAANAVVFARQNGAKMAKDAAVNFAVGAGARVVAGIALSLSGVGGIAATVAIGAVAGAATGLVREMRAKPKGERQLLKTAFLSAGRGAVSPLFAGASVAYNALTDGAKAMKLSSPEEKKKAFKRIAFTATFGALGALAAHAMGEMNLFSPAEAQAATYTPPPASPDVHDHAAATVLQKPQGHVAVGPAVPDDVDECILPENFRRLPRELRQAAERFDESTPTNQIRAAKEISYYLMRQNTATSREDAYAILDKGLRIAQANGLMETKTGRMLSSDMAYMFATGKGCGVRDMTKAYFYAKLAGDNNSYTKKLTALLKKVDPGVIKNVNENFGRVRTAALNLG